MSFGKWYVYMLPSFIKIYENSISRRKLNIFKKLLIIIKLYNALFLTLFKKQGKIIIV